MSAIDWVGWVVATAICLLVGWWLHRLDKKALHDRLDEMAIGFGAMLLVAAHAQHIVGAV